MPQEDSIAGVLKEAIKASGMVGGILVIVFVFVTVAPILIWRMGGKEFLPMLVDVMRYANQISKRKALQEARKRRREARRGK